jgi:hypothetical protein
MGVGRGNSRRWLKVSMKATTEFVEKRVHQSWGTHYDVDSDNDIVVVPDSEFARHRSDNFTGYVYRFELKKHYHNFIRCAHAPSQTETPPSQVCNITY